MTREQRTLTQLAATVGGRRNGRTTHQKHAMLAEIAMGGHVHYLTRDDGTWCGTSTELGPLWERLPRQLARRSAE